MSQSPPLVSIGMPTFNRAATLRVALESALAQDYPSLEIVVSDNASTDGTREVCEAAAARDPRVRYVRQDTNVGAVDNFMAVFAGASGEYFMWLSDDDWIDPGYVSACAHELQAHPDYALVCGRVDYWMGEERVFDGTVMQLRDEDPARRVMEYFRRVTENGTFHGVIRRAWMPAEPIRPVLGTDWLLLGTLAARGKIVTLESVRVHRSAAGLSRDMTRMSRQFGVSRLWSQLPHMVIAGNTLREIGWQDESFRSLAPAARLRVAATAATSIAYRFTVQPRLLRLFPGTGLVALGRRVKRALAPARE